jgi:hypothetical protein
VIGQKEIKRDMSVGKDKMAACQEELKSKTSAIKAGENKFKEKITQMLV